MHAQNPFLYDLKTYKQIADLIGGFKTKSDLIEARKNAAAVRVVQCCQPEQHISVLLTDKLYTRTLLHSLIHTFNNFTRRAPLRWLASVFTPDRFHSPTLRSDLCLFFIRRLMDLSEFNLCCVALCEQNNNLNCCL